MNKIRKQLVIKEYHKQFDDEKEIKNKRVRQKILSRQKTKEILKRMVYGKEEDDILY